MKLLFLVGFLFYHLRRVQEAAGCKMFSWLKGVSDDSDSHTAGWLHHQCIRTVLLHQQRGSKKVQFLH